MQDVNFGELGDWMIIYGKKCGVEGYALSEVNRVMHRAISSVIRVEEVRSATNDIIKNFNTVLIGTDESNPLIRELYRSGFIQIEKSKPESITVHIADNPYCSGKQIIVLTGADESGVLYAVRDFEHYVFDAFIKVNSVGRYCRLPFHDQLPDTTIVASPKIHYRGLWTWGHVIYDWRRYIDNMSHWKMNIVVIWNDFAPINASEIVTYAHERGIKVIWGYTWGWGEKIDPTSDEELNEWADKVLKRYESEYRETGCDGIYFQIFTETNETEIKGCSIAELSVKWVNGIARRLLDRYPNLWILFGVHATSIKDSCQKLADIDERISIVWEDVGAPIPQFPYSYEPNFDYNLHQPILSYTRNIASLRGDKENMGIVIKSMTNLDWSKFIHQPGKFVLGEYPSKLICKLAQGKEPRWKFVEIEWRQYLAYLIDVIKTIVSADPYRSSVIGLVEDGLWEERMWFPVALLAEVAWNPDLEAEKIIRKVSATEDACKMA